VVFLLDRVPEANHPVDLGLSFVNDFAQQLDDRLYAFSWVV
jgi:hypothetical protein